MGLGNLVLPTLSSQSPITVLLPGFTHANRTRSIEFGSESKVSFILWSVNGEVCICALDTRSAGRLWAGLLYRGPFREGGAELLRVWCRHIGHGPQIAVPGAASLHMPHPRHLELGRRAVQAPQAAKLGCWAPTFRAENSNPFCWVQGPCKWPPTSKWNQTKHKTRS